MGSAAEVVFQLISNFAPFLPLTLVAKKQLSRPGLRPNGEWKALGHCRAKAAPHDSSHPNQTAPYIDSSIGRGVSGPPIDMVSPVTGPASAGRRTTGIMRL